MFNELEAATVGSPVTPYHGQRGLDMSEEAGHAGPTWLFPCGSGDGRITALTAAYRTQTEISSITVNEPPYLAFNYPGSPRPRSAAKKVRFRPWIYIALPAYPNLSNSSIPHSFSVGTLFRLVFLSESASSVRMAILPAAPG